MIIDDADENAWLWTQAHALDPDDWWIGASDLDRQDDWEWVDGSPVDWSSWRPGAPESGIDLSDCGELDGDLGGQWDDSLCTADQPFICEHELS